MRRTILLLLLASNLLLLPGCGRKKTVRIYTRNNAQLRACLGVPTDDILCDLKDLFEEFLIRNEFVEEGSMMSGYKSYLKYILYNYPDSSWTYNVPASKRLIERIEDTPEFMRMIDQSRIHECMHKINYADTMFMALYTRDLPVEQANPAAMGQAFLERVDEDEFRDPVLRKMIALEYFLGLIVDQVRPDPQYQGHQH